MDKIFEWFLPIKKDDGMVLRGIRVGETAPKVRMHLIDDSGKGADITGVDAVSVIVERSDGMKVALTLSTQAVLCFSPAVVELSFEDARLSAVAGLCTGVIDFYSGDVRMTSARFRYNVEPGIDVSDDDIAQDPEYSMFVGAMTDLAMLNKEVSEAESARNVFEEYNPEKEYVKGNKVAYAGSSYVLVAESAIGTSPTDADSWLCVAEAGSRCFGFPYVDINVGKHLLISFDWGDHNKEDYPGIDEWRASDILMTANGKVLKISAVIKMGAVVKFVEVLCIADIKGESGESVFISDENGNVTYGDNRVVCKAYYIKSIDLNGKKIYLSTEQVVPVISSADNTNTDMDVSGYEAGKLFCIINGNQYLMRASIVSAENNVITYDGDLGFTEILDDEGEDAYTFFVPEQPDMGVVNIVFGGFSVGVAGIVAGSYGTSLGYGGVALKYGTVGGKKCRAVYTATAFCEECDALGQGSSAIGVKCKTTPKAYGGSATGIKTVSNAHGQGVRGKYNVIDEDGDYLDIVGNGTAEDKRSNAYTLDKEGNACYSGRVYQLDDRELAEKAVTDKLGAKLSIEPYMLYARKDGKLYSSARSSCGVVEKEDTDGIVYDHVTPLNHASKLLYDKYTEAGNPFEIPLSSGKIWLKLLMRSNQTATPTAELYQIVSKSGTSLSTISRVATKAMSGNGEWEEVVIPFDGYAANADKAKQIHIRLAGYNVNGSDFYDANGKLIGDPYFDIAGWAIFTDEEIFNLYEFYNEMVGIGSASVADLLMRVRELEGAMVFKDIVEALPTSAKENDVYTVSTWKKAGTFVCSAVLNNNSIVFSEWNDLANHLYSDVQSNYGCSYKLVIGGISYVYTDCGVSGAGDWGFDMVGYTDDVGASVTVPSGTTIELYSLPGGASVVNKSYIYRGGEWVPLFG